MDDENEKLDRTPDIRAVVEEKLEQGLSLEEIGELRTSEGEFHSDDVTAVIDEYRKVED
jgi:hypothetical protein